MTEVPPGYVLTWSLNGQKERIELGAPRMVVGRAQGVEIHINTPNVSRRHAAFSWESDGWVLADLGSSNGTWVNRQRIVSTRLKHGDAIAFGPLEARFLAPAAQQDVQDLVVIEEREGEVQHSILVSMEKLEGAMLPGPRTPAPTSQMKPRGGTSQVDAARADLGARAIGLFSQAAKALLASRSLDELLEKIMDLVFDVLPAERGFVGLIEPGQSEPVPRIMRTRTGYAEKITISRSIASTAIHERNAILVIDAPSDPRFQEQQSILLMKIRSAMCAPLYHEGNVQGLIYVDTQSATSFFDQDALEMLATLAVLAAVGVQQTRLREEIAREQKIREHLGRYSSPAVVEQIIRTAGGTGAIEMHAEEREVSVLFCDLTGFTAMAESMAPTEVTRLLNSLFDRLTQVIFRLEGTLDKFMGDAIMAVFGAPLAQDDHAVRAVTAAMHMQAELTAFNQTLGDGREIRMRIGINSGPVVAGDVGSPQRKEYTVIGDTVNVASRLESSVAAPGQVVVGPSTCALVQHCYQCEALPPAALKGKALRIQPYLVRGPLAEEETVRPPA
jgi:adenylate cyclase